MIMPTGAMRHESMEILVMERICGMNNGISGHDFRLERPQGILASETGLAKKKRQGLRESAREPTDCKISPALRDFSMAHANPGRSPHKR
jgi:hypothetical protein